jgi:solute carrier family 25 uncoupling protein 8/9
VDVVHLAQAATIPFDTTKVRMQIRNNATSAAAAATAAPGAGAPPGFVGTLTHIAKTEGAGALFRGLTPGLQRQLLFGSIRLGLYEPVRGALGAPNVFMCIV